MDTYFSIGVSMLYMFIRYLALYWAGAAENVFKEINELPHWENIKKSE